MQYSLGRFGCMYICVYNVMHPMVLHVGVHGIPKLDHPQKYLILCSWTLLGTAHNLQEAHIVLPTLLGKPCVVSLKTTSHYRLRLNSHASHTSLYYGGQEVQRLSSVIRHPSSVIRHPSSVICHPSSVICHPSSDICHLIFSRCVMGVVCLLASAHVFASCQIVSRYCKTKWLAGLSLLKLEAS